MAAGTGQARLFMIGSEEEEERGRRRRWRRSPAALTSAGGGGGGGGEEQDARPSQVLWGKALDGKNLMPGSQPARERERER